MSIKPEICNICNIIVLVEGISTVNIGKLATLNRSYIYLNNTMKSYSISKVLINDDNFTLMA